jgi:hypothetical protein
MGSNKADPKFAEELCIYSCNTESFGSIQPNKLEIEVVVGEYDVLFGYEAADVLHLALSFVWSAHSAAYIFAYPAGVHLVSVAFKIKLHKKILRDNFNPYELILSRRK